MKARISAAVPLLLLSGALFVTMPGMSGETGKPGVTAVDPMPAAEHLSAAIRFRTISYQDTSKIDTKEFLAFHEFLRAAYPALHRALKRETIGLSLLYTWPGTDAASGPILLMGHLDVVPVEKGTEDKWKHPPFSGAIDGTFVWGRGALDIKNNVIGIMEAVELLVREGFAPRRTVYIAFGHDEEVGGWSGNAEICRALKIRGARLSYVLDEGGSIINDALPGVARPAALVGIAEKGYLSLELSASDAGGHSSMPPRHTAVARLARAVYRLDENPFPPRLTLPVRGMFEYLGEAAGFGYRFVYTHPGLFKAVLLARMANTPSSDAMIRTTIAPTMLEGSQKDNVLPQTARAVVNFRILPGDSCDGVISRVKEIVDDPGITVKPVGFFSEPSRVSDVGSPEFLSLKKTINALFPDVVVAPYLVVGATDSRHYADIASQTFRFNPSRLSREDMKRIHGTDERINLKDLGDFVGFYRELIRDTAR